MGTKLGKKSNNPIVKYKDLHPRYVLKIKSDICKRQCFCNEELIYTARSSRPVWVLICVNTGTNNVCRSLNKQWSKIIDILKIPLRNAA
jgi:hypothetical protein